MGLMMMMNGICVHIYMTCMWMWVAIDNVNGDSCTGGGDD